MEVIRGKKQSPWSILIYGVPGVGKSSLASFAPDPIFCNLENGLERIGVDRSPHLKDWGSFFQFMKWAKENKDYKTVCLDTLAPLEDILIAQILAEHNASITDKKYHVKSISDKEAFAYGAGFMLLKAKWALVIQMIEKIKAAGKNVVCVAHESLERVTNPEGDDYSRYSPNIHKKSLDFFVSQMDGVFFCHYEKLIRSKDGVMGQKVKYGQDTGKRFIQTVEKMTALAKNRFDMKPLMPFNSLDDSKKFFDYVK